MHTGQHPLAVDLEYGANAVCAAIESRAIEIAIAALHHYRHGNCAIIAAGEGIQAGKDHAGLGTGRQDEGLNDETERKQGFDMGLHQIYDSDCKVF